MGEQERVVRYWRSIKVDKDATILTSLARKQLRVVLHVSPQGPPHGFLATSLQTFTPLSLEHEIHVIDNIHISKPDVDEAEIMFYLPRNHGLKPADVYVCLWSNRDLETVSLSPL